MSLTHRVREVELEDGVEPKRKTLKRSDKVMKDEASLFNKYSF